MTLCYASRLSWCFIINAKAINLALQFTPVHTRPTAKCIVYARCVSADGRQLVRKWLLLASTACSVSRISARVVREITRVIECFEITSWSIWMIWEEPKVKRYFEQRQRIAHETLQYQVSTSVSLVLQVKFEYWLNSFKRNFKCCCDSFS